MTVKARRLFEDEQGGMAFREIFTPLREGPLPPRPQPSGKGGPSTNQTPPVVASVLSVADASANGMTLTNGGLTVTTTTGAFQSVRVSTGHSSGRWYTEIKQGALSGTVGYGFADATFVPTTYLGGANYSAQTTNGSGNFVSPSGFTSLHAPSGFPVANGDVIGIAIDFTAANIWFSRNNVWIDSGNPATGAVPIFSFVPAITGALFVGIAFSNAGSVATLQAAAASQTYAPPVGFTPWG